MEPFWQKFKAPIAPIDAKQIIMHLIAKWKNPTELVFDDMTQTCNFLGGGSSNPLSSIAHEEWFNSDLE